MLAQVVVDCVHGAKKITLSNCRKRFSKEDLLRNRFYRLTHSLWIVGVFLVVPEA